MFTEDRTRAYVLIGVAVFFCALLLYSAFFYRVPDGLK
jgi:hypothetical protein